MGCKRQCHFNKIMYKMNNPYIYIYTSSDILIRIGCLQIMYQKLSLSKSTPASRDPFDELDTLFEVSSSSSVATNALSSSNCNPTSPWLWDVLLVRLVVISAPALGIFSFIILIVVCLSRPILLKKKSYTSMSTLSSMRVDILG